jgi:hypothetical protein
MLSKKHVSATAEQKYWDYLDFECNQFLKQNSNLCISWTICECSSHVRGIPSEKPRKDLFCWHWNQT